MLRYVIALLGLIVTAEFAIAKSAAQSAEEILKEVTVSEKYKRIAQDIVNSGQEVMAAQSKQDENHKSQDVIDIKKLTSGISKMKQEHEKLPELLVFISFSLPKSGLKELAVQVKRVGGVFVLRGLYKNSLKATVKLIHELHKDGVKAIIHPKLFKEFDVKVVPTFILHNGTCEHCSPLTDRITGNLTLRYVLESFADHGDHKGLANKYLARLEGKV